MSPIVIAIIVVAVLFVVGFFALRGKKSLPAPEEKPALGRGRDRAPAPKGEQAAQAERAEAGPAAAEKAKAAEVAAPEPQPEPQEEPVGEGVPVRPVPTEVTPAREPLRERPSSPTKEEVEELRKGLASTREGFVSRLAKLFGGKSEIEPALLDEIEEVLVTADIGVPTTQKILGQLRERHDRQELPNPEAIWAAIRQEATDILGNTPGGLDLRNRPTVILVVGVNGTGKTTTIGKLASKLVREEKKVILAAGDTFRAAAVLQLEVWGRKVGCQVVKGKDRADPSAVIFDAVKKGIEGGADVVIADTAGRLHTKAPLMEELKKVGRSVEKALERPADEILLVLDSTTGQNAIQQAQMFKEALDLTGIVLTKLDGTAKGGVILGIADEHHLPVRFIGIGERVEDLREFDTPSFVQAMFANPGDETMAA